MGAGEETGCFSSPALAAAALRLLRAASPPPRSSLPDLPPRRRARIGRWRHPGSVPRAPRTALLSCSASVAGPVVHPVPPSKKSARPSVPPLRAPSRPRAQPELSRHRRPEEKLGMKNEREPGEPRLSDLGDPEGRQGQKGEEKGWPLAETSISSFQKRSPRINFLWPTRRLSFEAARTLDWKAACAGPADPSALAGQRQGASSCAAPRGTRPRAPPAPRARRPLPDGPASRARASPSLSVPAEHRSLAGSLGAPALCPR